MNAGQLAGKCHHVHGLRGSRVKGTLSSGSAASNSGSSALAFIATSMAMTGPNFTSIDRQYDMHARSR